MEFVHAGFASALWASALLALTAAACTRTGSCVLRPILSGQGVGRFEGAVLGCGTGLLIFAVCEWVLGSAGLLGRGITWALLAIFMAAPRWAPNRASTAGDVNALRIERPPLLVLFLCVPVLFLAWLQAVAPPVGNDALAYHLAHPRLFLENGRIDYLPQTRESLWPYLTEMLYLSGLALEGTSLAKLFHWLFYALTAAAIYGLSFRLFNKKAASFAVVVYLFTPAAFAQAGYAYVDHSLAFYVLLSVYVFFLMRPLGPAKAAMLCGLFCGAALSVKYLALGLFAAWFLVWVFASRRWKEPALFLAFSLAVSFGWYLKSWIVLGNPVYPFFHSLFGGSGYATTVGDAVGMGKDALSFLLLGFRMTFYPAAFGGEILGPFYLIFLPALLIMWKGSRAECRWVAVLLLLDAAYLFTQSQQVRFFLSIVPVLAVGAGAAMDDLSRRGGILRKTVFSAAALLVLVHGAMFVYRTRNAWEPWFGTVSVQEYLERYERSFKGYRYLQAEVAPEQKILVVSEPRRFYSSLPRTVYYTDALKEDLRRQGIGPERFLNQERFDFIWIREESDPSFEEYLRGKRYRKVFSYTFKEGGSRFPFAIYKAP